MPDLALQQFQQFLLQSGVAPGHVRRTVAEIRDHHEDLRQQAIDEGMAESDAVVFANESIGDLREIAGAMVKNPAIRAWTYRYPRIARICLPIAFVALLPVSPIFAGIARATSIARWGACMMLGAIVTAAMLLVMQLSIALT